MRKGGGKWKAEKEERRAEEETRANESEERKSAAHKMYIHTHSRTAHTHTLAHRLSCAAADTQTETEIASI